MKRLDAVITVATVALVLLSAGLHFFDLKSDPPPSLSTSAGAYFDGFSNAHAARSHVLFGNMRPDEWDPYIYSPTHVLLQIPWFRIWGTGIRATHGFTALFSVAALMAAASCFRRYGRPAVWLAGFMFAFSYMYLQFGRLGLFETLMIFFMFCSVSCLAPSAPRGYHYFAAGSFAMLAFATKAIGVYFLPGFAIGIAAAAARTWKSSGRRAGLAVAGWAAAGWSAVFASWLVLFRIPNNEAINRIGVMWENMTFPSSIGQALRDAATTRAFASIGRYDSTWVIAIIVAAFVVYTWLRKPLSADPVAAVLTGWLVCGLAMTSALTYTATRYFYPLLPPALCLTAYGLVAMLRAESIASRPQRPWAADIAGLIAGTAIVRFHLLPRWHLERLAPDSIAPIWGKLLVSAALACIVWTALRVFLGLLARRIAIPRAARYASVALACVYFAFKNGDNTLRWIRYPRSYTLARTSRMLRAYPDMTLGGTTACAAVSETTHRAVRIGKPGWYNDVNPFERRRITHVFLTDRGNETQRFRKLYPEFMDEADEIATMKVCGYPFRLFAIHRPE